MSNPRKRDDNWAKGKEVDLERSRGVQPPTNDDIPPVTLEELIEQYPASDTLCADCAHPKDDPSFHFEAPGTNWGAALHHFRPASDAPTGPAQVAAATEHTCDRCHYSAWVPVPRESECDFLHPHVGTCERCDFCWLYRQLAAAQERIAALENARYEAGERS